MLCLSAVFSGEHPSTTQADFVILGEVLAQANEIRKIPDQRYYCFRAPPFFTPFPQTI